jgi:hypothetical protein
MYGRTVFDTHHSSSLNINGRHKIDENKHRASMHYVYIPLYTWYIYICFEGNNLISHFHFIKSSYHIKVCMSSLISYRSSVIWCRIDIDILIWAFRDPGWLARALLLLFYEQMTSLIHKTTNLCLRWTLYIPYVDGSLYINRKDDALKNGGHCK